MDALSAYLESGGRVLEGDALGRLTLPRVYARGALALDYEKAVAIVGSRAASVAGLKRAHALASAASAAGWVVVSGGANGIDTAAHQAAIEAGGRTVAVLGQPAGVPDERRPWMRTLFDRDPKRALALSTSAPGTGHDPRMFAARNKYIAVLADAVIVVEGAVGSGTRYTADAATAAGIALWVCLGDAEGSAVPYELFEAGRARPLAPLRNGAEIFGPPPAQAELPLVDEPVLLAAVRRAGGRLLVDQAARDGRRSAGDVLAEAVNLELDGVPIAVEGPFLVATSGPRR